MLSDADAKRISDLSKKGSIIYVIRNRSRLEYLMLSYLFTKKGLPAPVFAHYISMYFWQSFGQTLRRTISRFVAFIEHSGYPNPYKNGFVEGLIEKKKATLLPARHFAGLPWRFSRQNPDPLADIIRICEKHNYPVYLLPIEFAYGRRPDRDFVKTTDLFLGTKVEPSKIRQLLMAINHRKSTSILVSTPMSLELEVDEASIMAPDTAERTQEIAYTLRTKCIQRINAERRVVLGPVLKTRSERIEQILHDREMFQFLRDHSKEDEKDFVALRRDARKMLNEIAADYNPTTVQIVIWLLTKAFKRLYAGMEINLDQLDQVRSMAREMPVVYIPCHKSHIDYLIVNYLLYINKLSVPYIVSGVNLNFWPLGAIFRGGGAFFMRRTFVGKRLYSKVFSKYVEYVLRDNIPIEFFIEGTRSRTGKIVLPKLGFLSILMNAVLKSEKKNLCIVPVSINYEHIFEQSFYLKEAKGKKNEGENISTMLKHGKMIRKKMGRFYLEIAEPFTLSELLTDYGGRIPRDTKVQKELAGTLAYRVAHAINSQSIATPYSIVATAMLAGKTRGMYLHQIQSAVKLILEALKMKGVRVVGLTENWVEQVLDHMLSEKIVSTETEDEEEGEEEDRIFFLDDDKRFLLTIYKNSIVHHIPFISLLSLCFLAAGEPVTKTVLYERYRFIKKVIGGELIYSDNKRQSEQFDRETFEKALEFFTGHGFVTTVENELQVLNKDGQQAARAFAGAILDFVGTYYLLAKTLWKNRKEELSDKLWLKKAMKLGKRMHSTGKIQRLEAVHKNIIESGLRHLRVLDICESSAHSQDKYRRILKYKVKDLEALQNFIDDLKPFADM